MLLCLMSILFISIWVSSVRSRVIVLVVSVWRGRKVRYVLIYVEGAVSMGGIVSRYSWRFPTSFFCVFYVSFVFVGPV